MAAPCIITVAITGSLPRKKDNPAVPVTVAEQIESTQQAFEAGATLVHLHVRNDDESPTSSPERFAQVLDGIRKHCPGIITQVSTGGRSGAGRERGGMLSLKPDMASLATGSVELPDARLRQRAGSRRLAGRRDARVRHQAGGRGLRPVDDLLRGQPAEGRPDQGAAARPVRDGREERDAGGPRGLRVLRRKRSSVWRPDATWTGAGIGKDQFLLARWSLELGGHCRTGLEDNVRLDRDTLAPSNAALVERIAQLCAEHGRRPATPAEARQLLSLPAAA